MGTATVEPGNTTKKGLRWVPPKPVALPSWQQRQERYTRSNLSIDHITLAIEAGGWSVLPVPDAPTVNPARWAATLLASQESMRLEQARTFSFGPNATAMAVATAARAMPQERISASRLPSPSGMIVFADPIGHYTEKILSADGQAGTTHTPIVAASWSLWGPSQMQHLGPDLPITWLRNDPQGPTAIPGNTTGIWVSFYSARPSDVPDLPDEAPIGLCDGELVTAGMARQYEAFLSHQSNDIWGPLSWHDETVVPLGTCLEKAPLPETPSEWFGALYTAWQMMQQQAKDSPLVNIQRQNFLPPAARKKAKAQAKTSKVGPPVGDGAVHVVDLAAAHRPSQESMNRDAAASDGRKKVEWQFRFKVPPYRRMTCMNPRLHHDLQDGDLLYHEHREDLVPESTKGPKDKPLRATAGTTYTYEVTA